MNQKINLCVNFPSQINDPLTAKLIQQVAMMVFVVLAVIYAVMYWNGRTAQQELATLQAELSKISEEIVNFDDGKGNKLLAAIEATKAEIDQKTQLLKIMTEKGFSASGFSSELIAFAENITSGVWLDDIDILRGGADIELEGEALDMVSVLEYLERLNKSPVFSTRHLKLEDVTEVPVPPADEKGEQNKQVATTTPLVKFTITTNIDGGAS